MKRNVSTALPTAPASPAALPLVSTALVGLAASAPTANAQVIYTPVTSEGTISAGEYLYFDLGESSGTGSWGSDTFSGADFRLNFGLVPADPGPPPYVPGSQKPQIVPTDGARTVAQAAVPYYAQRLTAGTLIDSSLDWSYSGSLLLSNNGQPASPWQPGDSGYLGLRLGSGATAQYGWAHVEYTLDRQLTLHSFAVESSLNTGIQAAAVPEPKQTALLMTLLAGSVALFRRRQQAGAP
jgi:hypothetical protein